MEQFLKAVADTLRALDPSVTYSVPYASSGVLVVQGCEFECSRDVRYSTYGSSRYVYILCGGKFSLRADGKFDLPRAVQLVIAALPEALKARDRKAARKSREEKIAEVIRCYKPELTVASLDNWERIRNEDGCLVHLMGCDDGDYRLQIRAPELTIRAALDKLMEEGIIPQA